MFKKIFRLTTLSFIGPFLVVFILVLLTLLIQFLWKYIDDLVGKGLEWYVILQLLYYASASFVPLALPLSILLSSIMTFGNLSEHYELVALKSAGISLRRIMTPLTIVIIGLSVLAFFFSNDIIPYANLKFRSLLFDIRQQRPALDIKEGVFYSGIDNYSMRISRKDKNSNKIYGIRIYDHTHGRGNDILMTAERGEMFTRENNRYLVVKLYEGTRYEEMENKNPAQPSFPHSRVSFKSYQMQFDLNAFKLSRTNEDLFKGGYEMLNANQLSLYEDSTRQNLKQTQGMIYNYMRPFLVLLRDSSGIYKNLPDKKAEKYESSFINTIHKTDKKTVSVAALRQAQAMRTYLDEESKTIETYEEIVRRYRIEWHRKFTLSIACLALFLIGAPLGAIIRKGGLGLPVVVALIMFVLFYVLSMVFERTARTGAIDAFWGMWAPIFILMPMGLFLSYKANRDAINIDSLKTFALNLVSLKKKKS